MDNSGPDGGGIYCEGTTVLYRSIIAFSPLGAAVGGTGNVTLSCCDLYGNAGGDWVGAIAPQLGTSGNISLDPIFCDRPGGIATIRSDSPCAPRQSPTCGLIGAWPVGCYAPQSIPDPALASSPGFLCRPNPFRDLVTISRTPGGDGPAAIGIFDLAGRLLRRISATSTGAEEAYRWHGETDDGRIVPAGVYLVRPLEPGSARPAALVRIP